MHDAGVVVEVHECAEEEDHEFVEEHTHVRTDPVGKVVPDSAMSLGEGKGTMEEEDERNVVGEVHNVEVVEVDDLVGEHVHNDTVLVHIEDHTELEEGVRNVEVEEVDGVVVQGRWKEEVQKVLEDPWPRSSSDREDQAKETIVQVQEGEQHHQQDSQPAHVATEEEEYSQEAPHTHPPLSSSSNSSHSHQTQYSQNLVSDSSSYHSCWAVYPSRGHTPDSVPFPFLVAGAHPHENLVLVPSTWDVPGRDSCPVHQVQ